MTELNEAAETAAAASVANDDMFVRMALALAVGLIIGVQRGWYTRNAEAVRVGWPSHLHLKLQNHPL